jgi:hypothetical protein
VATAETERREARFSDIAPSAWKLTHEHGVGGVSLRALAREVRDTPTVAVRVFDSKQAPYDAMFAQGNRHLLERLNETVWPSEPRAKVK